MLIRSWRLQANPVMPASVEITFRVGTVSQNAEDTKKDYFWMYQPVSVSSSTFSLVGFVIRLTTIMEMTAITNA